MRPFFAATYVHVFVVWSFTKLITRLERGFFLPQFWWGALSSNVFTICAVYWSLGRRRYFGVSIVVLVWIVKLYIFTPNCAKCCSQRSNLWSVWNSSCNGLAPHKRHAFTWHNVDKCVTLKHPTQSNDNTTRCNMVQSWYVLIPTKASFWYTFASIIYIGEFIAELVATFVCSEITYTILPSFPITFHATGQPMDHWPIFNKKTSYW